MNIPKFYTVLEVKYKKRKGAINREVHFISNHPVKPTTANFKTFILKQEGY
jgi:hypothetical protein